jgi:glycerol uptake facilitator-like aquaporin
MFERFITEFFGTLLMVYILLMTKSPITVGSTLILIMLLSRPSSSGYFNPAITIAMSTYGMIQKSDVIPYCLSQALGGIQLFKFTIIYIVNV